MAPFIPITLVGNNLGERHKYLNSKVSEAFQQGVPFESIRDIPEKSPVDRLFKIDLASKYKNLDYIIENLKDGDLLYAKRSLKSLWLLEEQYSHIINPTYLEDVLYLEMVTTIVNTTRNWIPLHLRDPKRCEQFYLYYNKSSFELAIKFLWHCSYEFVKDEAGSVLEKLSPRQLRSLCFKCPQAFKIYYDSLETNQTLISRYLNKQRDYYKNLMCLLKMDPDLFLDIVEKYFNRNIMRRFSPAATKYVMDNHKTRFVIKPELYAAWLLHTETLAESLSVDEVKDLVLKLARAQYLDSWFSYKNVEPLIKRLSSDERVSFKKLVFVDKAIGSKVQEWPYKPPAPPQVVTSGTHVFTCSRASSTPHFRKLLTKRKYAKYTCNLIQAKTLLDQLFEQYRFASFERTLHELRIRLVTESSTQNRQYMLLVLVSKSGGRDEAVCKLAQLLARHGNEPPTLRAAVLRSLVKRAAAWRLPSDTWDQLGQFAHGLGLDGGPGDLVCREGLHAAVLRDLLHGRECPQPIRAAFLDNFSTLVEYPLNSIERRLVIERLPALLLSAADAEPASALQHLAKLLEVLDAYRVRVAACPGLVDAIAAAARQHPCDSQWLLQRLYNARVARKALFRENLEFIQTDRSYVNALRHDAGLLSSGTKFESLVARHDIHHELFLRKISIYFGEAEGLASRYLVILEQQVAKECYTKLARSMALLAGSSLLQRLRAYDVETEETAIKQFMSALRANMHVARLPLDSVELGWREAGVKAIANRVLVCKAKDIDRHIAALLSHRRTARLALVLAARAGREVAVIEAVAALRPADAVRAAFAYFKRRGEESDSRVWDAVRPIIAKLDFASPTREFLRNALLFTDSKFIPADIKPDYWVAVHRALRHISTDIARATLLNLKDDLPRVNEESITSILADFIRDDLVLSKIKDDEFYFVDFSRINMQMICTFLLLSESEEALERRLKAVGEPFFDRFKNLWEHYTEDKKLISHLDKFIDALMCQKVFFDSTYVVCARVLEIVVTWMHHFFPVGMWFGKYVRLHLIMLYCKTIRQCTKRWPEIFTDETRKNNEGVSIVGTAFGKNIARELRELTTKYFESVAELYKDELMRYMLDYFDVRDESRSRLYVALVRGLLEEGHVGADLLAQHIYSKEIKSYDNTDSEEILKTLKDSKNEAVKFFLYADMYD